MGKGGPKLPLLAHVLGWSRNIFTPETVPATSDRVGPQGGAPVMRVIFGMLATAASSSSQGHGGSVRLSCIAVSGQAVPGAGIVACPQLVGYLVKYQFSGLMLSVVLCGVTPFRLLAISVSW